MLNATSLAKFNATKQLFADIQTVRDDVVMTVETWFNNKLADCDLNLNGFLLFRRDRLHRQDGGLCSYVLGSSTCSVFQPGTNCFSSDVEIMWLELDFDHHVLFVALCYYPPKPVSDDFVSQLSEGIESVMAEYTDTDIIVAGDFNTSLWNVLSTNHGLLRLVDRPTHGQHISLLDKFFISHPDMCSVSTCISQFGEDQAYGPTCSAR